MFGKLKQKVLEYWNCESGDFGTILGIGASLLSGAMGSSAAGDAADAQAASADKGVAFQKEALKQTRGDLQPYREAGITALYGGQQYDQAAFDAAQRDFWAQDPAGSTTGKNGKTKKGKGFLDLKAYQALTPEERAKYERNDKGNFVYKEPKLQDFAAAHDPNKPGLVDLINDPNAQKNFITQNPFFNSLAQNAQDRTFQNAAAKGKVGSGGTAEALQNSLLMLGGDLLNQSITQRQNLANMGSDAAARSGVASQNAANGISDLYTQKGNAQAAGAIGSANAWNSSLGQITKLANPTNFNI